MGELSAKPPSRAQQEAEAGASSWIASRALFQAERIIMTWRHRNATGRDATRRREADEGRGSGAPRSRQPALPAGARWLTKHVK